MLTISTSQYAALDTASMERFYARLAGLVLQLRPDLEGRADAASLDQFARFATDQARTLGFTSEFEIAVFCGALLLQGKDFHIDPAHPLHQVVTRPGVEPRCRAAQLLYELEQRSQSWLGHNGAVAAVN